MKINTFIKKLPQCHQRHFFSADPLFRLEHLENKVGPLETTVTETRTVLGLILTQITGMRVDMNTMQADISTMKADISTTKAEIITTKADISTMKADISITKAEIITTKADISTMKASMNTMQTTIFTIDKVTKSTNRKVDGLKKNISSDFDVMCAAWIINCVAESFKKEITAKSFNFNYHFVDTEGIVDPSANGKLVDVEIDIFCEEPVLLAAELTWTLASGHVRKAADKAIEKMNRFIRKLEFLEKKFGERPRAFFICAAKIDKDLLLTLKELADRHKIRLVNFDGERKIINKVV